MTLVCDDEIGTQLEELWVFCPPGGGVTGGLLRLLLQAPRLVTVQLLRCAALTDLLLTQILNTQQAPANYIR